MIPHQRMVVVRLKSSPEACTSLSHPMILWTHVSMLHNLVAMTDEDVVMVPLSRAWQRYPRQRKGRILRLSATNARFSDVRS